jgi:hypothetical protein
MKTNPKYTNQLELFFDWTFIKDCELVLTSDEKINHHMFMIYTKDGNLLHGWHIEKVTIKI